MLSSFFPNHCDSKIITNKNSFLFIVINTLHPLNCHSQFFHILVPTFSCKHYRAQNTEAWPKQWELHKQIGWSGPFLKQTQLFLISLGSEADTERRQWHKNANFNEELRFQDRLNRSEKGRTCLKAALFLMADWKKKSHYIEVYEKWPSVPLIYDRGQQYLLSKGSWAINEHINIMNRYK